MIEFDLIQFNFETDLPDASFGQSMNEARFGWSEEDHGLAALTDTSRSAHSMHVILGRDGWVVLYNPVGWWQVKSSGGNVLLR